MSVQPGRGTSTRSLIKILVLVAVIGTVIVLGAITAIFFTARRVLKNSEANRAAVQALRRSRPVAEALGEIQDVGVPMGSISTEIGGSGSASLSMSVEGSKASGRYYATLERRNGRWFVVSGRVELSDGRSVSLEAAGPGRIDWHRTEGHQLTGALAGLADLARSRLDCSAGQPSGSGRLDNVEMDFGEPDIQTGEIWSAVTCYRFAALD